MLMKYERDQALLAKVISQGSIAANVHSYKLGRTAVQKIMYFLKVLNVPMGYRFEIYNYGPFSSKILQDTGWLIMDSVIQEDSQTPGSRSEYSIGANYEVLFDSYRESLSEYENLIDTVAKVFAPLATSELELYSTLDFLYREEKAKKGTGPWKGKVISRLNTVKNGKFSADRAEKAYMAMVKVKLISE